MQCDKRNSIRSEVQPAVAATGVSATGHARVGLSGSPDR